MAEFYSSPARRRLLEKQGLLDSDGTLLSKREADRKLREQQRLAQAHRNAEKRAAMEAESKRVCCGDGQPGRPGSLVCLGQSPQAEGSGTAQPRGRRPLRPLSHSLVPLLPL